MYLLQKMMEGKIWTILWGCLAILYVMGEDDSKNVVFPADNAASNSSPSVLPEAPKAVEIEERRNGKNLLDWLGFTIGGDTDPYLSKTNAACLEGDLSECFKSKALTSLEEFFDKDVYTFNENTRIVKMPSVQLRALQKEPYEFSSETRADESEWDQFVKYVMRKVEKFVKSTAFEVRVPDEVLAEARYAPRFIDEISSEIDIIEDKTDNVFSKYEQFSTAPT